MFYSATTKGFYSTDIHGVNIPSDAVEIEYSLYRELLQEQSYGRKILSGGEGSSGYRHSEETKRKIAEASRLSMTGRKKDPLSVEKMAATKRNRPLSKEHCLKISLGNIGRVTTEETIKKRALKTIGRKNSPQACFNISEGRKRALINKLGGQNEYCL